MNNRPKIKVSKNQWDYLIEFIGFAAVLFMLIYPGVHYGELPQEIPTHFDANGQPDNYGDKSSIWILPTVGVILFMGIQLLNRFPHIFNYPIKITPENAADQYRKAARLLRTVNSIVAIVFAYILFASVQTALSNQSGLGTSFIWIFVLLMMSPLVIYLLTLKK